MKISKQSKLFNFFFCFLFFLTPLIFAEDSKEWKSVLKKIANDGMVKNLLLKNAFQPPDAIASWKNDVYSEAAWSGLSTLDPIVLSLISSHQNPVAGRLAHWSKDEKYLMNVVILNRGGFVVAASAKPPKLSYSSESSFGQTLQGEVGKKVRKGFNTLYNKNIAEMVWPIQGNGRVIGAIWSIWDSKILETSEVNLDKIERLNEKEKIQGIPNLKPKKNDSQQLERF
jgi:hypothetical protein